MSTAQVPDHYQNKQKIY